MWSNESHSQRESPREMKKYFLNVLMTFAFLVGGHVRRWGKKNLPVC